MKRGLVVFLFAFLLIASCARAPPEPIDGSAESMPEPGEGVADSTEKTTDMEVGGEEVSSSGECQLPAKNVNLYFYTSDDGVSFSQGELIYDFVSVPHLYVDGDQLIASFQIFHDPPLCGGMAYLPLSFDGEVLEDVQPLTFTSEYFNAFDPTLVDVDERLALLHTVRPQGLTQPCISVAVGDDITSLAGQDILWCSENDDEAYMDASGVFIAPYLYVYVPSDKSWSGSPASYYAKVDVDTWEIIETGEITGVDIWLLGEMVVTNDDSCPYKFYGTYKGNVQTACTTDGVTFVVEDETIVPGADPGVAQLPDGSYVMAVVQE